MAGGYQGVVVSEIVDGVLRQCDGCRVHDPILVEALRRLLEKVFEMRMSPLQLLGLTSCMDRGGDLILCAPAGIERAVVGCGALHWLIECTDLIRDQWLTLLVMPEADEFLDWANWFSRRDSVSLP